MIFIIVVQNLKSKNIDNKKIMLNVVLESKYQFLHRLNQYIDRKSRTY